MRRLLCALLVLIFGSTLGCGGPTKGIEEPDNPVRERNPSEFKSATPPRQK